MDDDFRGTGNTTRQMQAAPQRAFFIWPSRNSISYAKELAHKIGRADLQIVTPDWFDDQKWRGLELSGIVVDHATHLSVRQHQSLERARINVR